MKALQATLLISILLALTTAVVNAHHNTQAEYGSFGSDFIYVEGTITKVNWGNPHVSFEINVSGGDLPATETGEIWTFNSHPIRIMNAYGFTKEEFNEGDRVRLLTWRHVRGIKQLWPRAIQINDGPMKSNLRFTDMIDIAKGTFDSLGILPAANLNGSPTVRAGSAAVAKLGEMGLLDEENNMIWPPR